MIVTVNIDIENARKTLEVASGSLEQAQLIRAMTDEEIKDEVLKHCKCWSMKEVKGQE